MGKIVEFPSGDGKEKKKGTKELRTEKLTQEEMERLVEPFRDGLKRLYPTQVKDVLGMVGFGEKRGKEVLTMGVLLWQPLKSKEPVASTFIALFQNDRLEKVSFLEAKNNYWDWNIMIETYQSRFNTKEMFRELQMLRKQLFSQGEEP